MSTNGDLENYFHLLLPTKFMIFFDVETQDKISTIGWKELSNIAELSPDKKELLRYPTDNIERELSSLLVDCSDYYVVTKYLHLFFFKMFVR